MSDQYDSREDNRRLLAALQYRHPVEVKLQPAWRRAFLEKMGKLSADMVKRRSTKSGS